MIPHVIDNQQRRLADVLNELLARCSGGPVDVASQSTISGCRLARLRRSRQNSALPGVRGNGMTSRMLAMPVMNWTQRSRPSPKPACGTVP
jgi:hypothetical protein